jgi:hypothetical protein
MKTPKIGFVILSHNYSEEKPQLHRLVRRLCDFPDTRIVIHHDFYQCPLPINAFNNYPVSFVHPHVKTSWGGMGIVEATVESIKLLLSEAPGLDWFVLLSANDYPVKSVAQILAFFKNSACDAYVDGGEYEKAPHAEFIHKAVFTKKRFSFPFVSRKGKFYFREFRLPVPKSQLPFNESFKLFNGEQWFMANQKTMRFLANIDYKNDPFVQYINTTTMAPDNVIFQSFIGNNANIKTDANDYRYIDWRNYKNHHPNTLTTGHFEALKNSPDLFARKVDYTLSADLLNRIDKELLGIQPKENSSVRDKNILTMSL